MNSDCNKSIFLAEFLGVILNLGTRYKVLHFLSTAYFGY